MSGEEYKFHEGYEGQKFINKSTGEVFDNVNTYNRSWCTEDSLVWHYWNRRTNATSGE